MGLAAGVAMGAAALLPRLAPAAQSAWTRISLEECISLSPEKMAEASGAVSTAWNGLLEAAQGIRNPAIRAGVLDILNNPAPTLAAKVDQSAVAGTLKSAGLLPENADNARFLPPFGAPSTTLQPFWSAPGSGWGSHHAYPGGLVTHTGFNVRSCAALLENYRTVFDLELNGDVVLAAELLHDLHKPWVFQWQQDGSCRKEAPLAGQGEHHVLSLAESLVRGLPPEVVVAQACAHNHPGTPKDEAEVVSWLRAACLLAGKDPVAEGLLEADGKTLVLPRRMEGFLVHLGDHDWVLAVPAAQWILPVLKGVAEQRYNLRGKDLEGLPFNAFRNYVLSQVTMLRLYQVYVAQGEAGVARLTERVVSR